MRQPGATEKGALNAWRKVLNREFGGMGRRRKFLRKALGILLCLSLWVCCVGCTGEGHADGEGAGEAGNRDNAGQTGPSGEQVKQYDTLTGADHSGVYGIAGELSAYDTTNTNYALNIDAGSQVHDISELLYGIFIEDINFAADGGLYAEMVQNRSFEFTSLAQGDEKHGWSDVGEITARVETGDKAGALNENNPNYMVLENGSDGSAGIANRGFLDGMAVTESAGYDFSIYARGLDGYTGPIHAAITVDGEVVAESEIPGLTDQWEKYELVLTPSVTAYSGVRLQVTIDRGAAAVDMVSLFPQDTYKGRKNGLRKDLAEKLEELHPAFLRFPGGCVVEGVTLEKAYDWKDSIGVGRDGEPLEFNGVYGDVAARKMGQNIWTDERTTNDANPSYMTYGLGFYEYFLLAEDIGAIGVPVLNCGMGCMAQGSGSGPSLTSEEFYGYIQDALDLVEFCRGGADTKWGALRISMGHEEPFQLKYIGIGNENWGTDFFRRYQAFVEAFIAAREEDPGLYGDIQLIFTAGTDDGDSGHSMYMAAYNLAAEWLEENENREITDFAGAIDHHYYNTPDWFLSHADYYDEDNYSRDTGNMTDSIYGGGMDVFLGEYAAQANNWRAALAEAAYMTGLERNGDIVVMSAYAPLFGNLTATHWAPDLIWFNNHQVTCSVNYYVQKVFSLNAGTALLSSELEGAELTLSSALQGKVGVASWNTAVKFDNVKIVDNNTGKVLAEDDFSSDSLGQWEKVSDGNWSIVDGELIQSSSTTDTNRYSTTGSAIYFGDESWNNYTYTVEATKTGGQEGFLIPFAVGGKDNNFFWNIGGWNNTVSCLQQVKEGVKSDQVSGTVSRCVIKTGQTYTIKIEVLDTCVKCYLDDKLMIDYDLSDVEQAESYQVVSTDETGDIIVKLVNETGAEKTYAIDITDAGDLEDTADVDLVAGKSLADDNILGREEVVTMESSQISGITSQFNYTVPAYSVTVLRLHRK